MTRYRFHLKNFSLTLSFGLPIHIFLFTRYERSNTFQPYVRILAARGPQTSEKTILLSCRILHGRLTYLFCLFISVRDFIAYSENGASGFSFVLFIFCFIFKGSLMIIKVLRQKHPDDVPSLSSHRRLTFLTKCKLHFSLPA